MNTPKLLSISAAASLAAVVSSPAAVITFTGGTAYFNGGGSAVTSDAGNWNNVDYYEEDGFRLDFIGNVTAFATHIGDYYSAGNAVIHAHWDSGNYGETTKIVVTKIDNTPFDLNYFILTSNTDFGGFIASGNERAFIKNNNGNDILLPPEDWGFPAQQIYLPASYDGITSFEFYVENAVDCFGMDEFYIDEEPPPPTGVPEGGSTVALFAAALAGLLGGSARRGRSAR